MDFFVHPFLHDAMAASPSKRILDQMSQAQRVQQSPGLARRSPAVDVGPYGSPVHRVGSEQTNYLLGGGGGNDTHLARPASTARAFPATYSSSPVKRRPDASAAGLSASPRITTPRSLADQYPPQLQQHQQQQAAAQDQPPRPPKTQRNQAMTDSGEFTFLPPLSQPQRPGSRQGGGTPNEHAIKQVQVHSSPTQQQQPTNSRAVPVPSQRLTFARMEQERLREVQSQRVQSPSTPAPECASTRPNFDQMQPRIEDMNPPRREFYDLPPHWFSEIRRARVGQEPAAGPDQPTAQADLLQRRGRRGWRAGLGRALRLTAPHPVQPDQADRGQHSLPQLLAQQGGRAREADRPGDEQADAAVGCLVQLTAPS